ncbi:M23 family metallopeptidase [Niveibacterium sp. 24ML]|uniref:M23 family metallopeptidase n=1 Tax=Niveibacterium sp. 24ML TaxID=2985512 RepID=UPI00226DBF1F|nr:M23 family metallopeptidase [Niveibacterium sp. 24ML]MCX9156212.1 M23 family metallopeptidase [Niveibacterium sp. 24ML]
MAFVMLSTGGLSSSGVRTLSVRTVLLAGAGLAMLLLVLGALLGYLLAGGSPAALPKIPMLRQNPYTVEQLGAISGRVFKLENEAAHLGRKIGVMDEYESKAVNKAGKGGPMLPPRVLDSHDPLAELDAALARVEGRLNEIGEATAQRNLAHMMFPSRLPVEGAEIGSAFGNRMDPFNRRLAFHAGLDFTVDPGTPIRASAGGIVAFAGWNHDFGWVVELDHGNGLMTRYAHASKLLVKTGNVVAPGQEIARVGSSGRSTGAHLHFEVMRDGQYVDPADYLAGL